MKKFIVFGIVSLFFCMSLVLPTGGIGRNCNNVIDINTKITSDETCSADNGTEYWALLLYMGIYAGHPGQNFPPEFLEDFEKFHNKLLVSEHWKEENVKVIKGRRATLLNIIRGLRWLDRKEDENDFSLVYISTHGGQLPKDRLPWDEEDGCDEVLATYLSFMFPRIHLSDDLLNLLLSFLDSKGVCVVVDSCHAGGFNDSPYFQNLLKNNEMNADEWVDGFAEELSESGRVVLMSSREDELSCGGFTTYLTEGLTGYANSNEDDLVSAEEAFYYAKERYDWEEYNVHATIYDDYSGELPLTEVELPPSIPGTPTGEIFGDINTTYYYTTKSIDPEGDKISYGWDWDGDFTVDEWTDFVESNTTVNISHSWAIEGLYSIKAMAKDERGVISKWSKDITAIMCGENIPDQIQREGSFGAYINNAWLAQSFVPSLDILSKVELAIGSYGSKDPSPLNLYIRDNLSGDNLAVCSMVVPETEWGRYAWYAFDFEDLDVIPGNTYYIICEKVMNWAYAWKGRQSDCYPLGEAFHSNDGNDWHIFSNPPVDFCFVTWGK